ncbi:MAG: CpsD/CapB family tyrosine-protein kinase, partial [Eubacteriales bacterium]
MSDYSILTFSNPKSVVSEAYRILRTNIEFANIDNSVKKILFTSSGPGEGKSSTVANLAYAMVQSGKNVLIIDADLRKPVQHKFFDLENAKGLSNTLVEEVPSMAYVQKTTHKGLFVLSSGVIPPNPAELLASKRMKQVLADVYKHFDIILIDSPPIIAVTDSSILAQLADGVILVLSSGNVNKDYALKAKERIESVGARILGTILNKVEMKSGEQYYYYYYGDDRKKARDNKTENLSFAKIFSKKRSNDLGDNKKKKIRPKKKRISRKKSLIIAIVSLCVVILLITASALWAVDMPTFKTSPVLETVEKIDNVEVNGGTVSLGEGDLNSIIQLYTNDDRVKSYRIKVNAILNEGNIEFYALKELGGNTRALLYSKGKISYSDEYIIFTPEIFKIGRLPVPTSMVLNKLKSISYEGITVKNDGIYFAKDMFP